MLIPPGFVQISGQEKHDGRLNSGTRLILHFDKHRTIPKLLIMRSRHCPICLLQNSMTTSHDQMPGATLGRRDSSAEMSQALQASRRSLAGVKS